jgi:hypothetical protein
LEEVEGSEAASRKLWRRPKAPDASLWSSGDGRKLWRLQEALAEVEGSKGSIMKLWRRSKVLEEVEGSDATNRKLWRQQEALEAVGSSGGGRRIWRKFQRFWRRLKGEWSFGDGSEVSGYRKLRRNGLEGSRLDEGGLRRPEQSCESWSKLWRRFVGWSKASEGKKEGKRAPEVVASSGEICFAENVVEKVGWRKAVVKGVQRRSRLRFAWYSKKID